MTVESEYGWPRPPVGGWTSDDLDRLPNLPPHTELLYGSLIFASPQTAFHMRAIRLLDLALLSQAPTDLDVAREYSVELDRKNRLEPDVFVFRTEADTGPKQTKHLAKDVILAVEVVSEESQARDRDTKPRKYAEAGIPHFWRVEENEKGMPVVYVYELDPATRTYVPTGIFHERLVVTEPFGIDIDLTAINRRPKPE